MSVDRENTEPIPPNPPGRRYESPTSGAIRQKLALTRPILTRLGWAGIQGAITETRAQRTKLEEAKLKQLKVIMDDSTPDQDIVDSAKPKTIKDLLARELEYARTLDKQRLVVSAIENIGKKIVDIILEKR